MAAEETGMNSDANIPAGGIALILLFASCAVFSPSLRLEPVRLGVEERNNGFLVELLTQAAIREKATTIIVPPNWLIVTLPDTSLDTVSIAAFRSPLVDSTEVHRFETVTQYSIRFRKKISSAEILNVGSFPGLVISVFF
ncbi:MAG: hypothetical protein HBSIN02_00270 [Bacteroidia bacterium]|nr:MAG: hypothetical protein HBSIN02_00270 [Bacteroidia bacterium]